jgi:Tfp pilus assembly protein FimV
MAIAGALVATAPQAHAAVRMPATAAAEQARTDALVLHDAQPATRTYTVRPGDTLAAIAESYYSNPDDWQWIYNANRSEISDPNSIYVGETLTIPYGATSYTPRHATSTPQSTTVLTSTTSNLSGTLSCSGLEALWEAAGGSQAEALMAAEIAMAESGGNQFALSPTNDYGYWQINGSHGQAQATFDPVGNAKAAVAISGDGSDWLPWTTYVTGAYQGRC